MTKDQPRTLRDVAQAALDAHPGTSGRELERVAKRRGLTISYTTINHLAAGTYLSKPSAKTLAALAALSGYTTEQVYRAAGKRLPGPSFAEQLPPDVDNLAPQQRDAVITVIRAFLSEPAPNSLGVSVLERPAEDEVADQVSEDRDVVASLIRTARKMQEIDPSLGTGAFVVVATSYLDGLGETIPAEVRRTRDAIAHRRPVTGSELADADALLTAALEGRPTDEEAAEANAAVRRLDDHVRDTRPARTRQEMQQLEDRVARDE